MPTSVRHDLRHAVADRDGWACWICEQPIHPEARPRGLRPSLDHVVEVRHGGTDDVDNLRLAHACCNESRDRNRSAWERAARVMIQPDRRYAWTFTVRPREVSPAGDSPTAGERHPERPTSRSELDKHRDRPTATTRPERLDARPRRTT
jgi:hypothetical protein